MGKLNKMGKAYANRKPKEERHTNDKYETPYSLTWELQKLNIEIGKVHMKEILKSNLNFQMEFKELLTYLMIMMFIPFKLTPQ